MGLVPLEAAVPELACSLTTRKNVINEKSMECKLEESRLKAAHAPTLTSDFSP